MANTTYYGFAQPELKDRFQLNVWNKNLADIDYAIHEIAGTVSGAKIIWSGCATEITGITLPNEYFYNEGQSILLLINAFMGVTRESYGIPDEVTNKLHGMNLAQIIGVNIGAVFSKPGKTYSGVNYGKDIRQDLFYIGKTSTSFQPVQFGRMYVEITTAAGMHTLSINTTDSGSQVPIITSVSALKNMA